MGTLDTDGIRKTGNSGDKQRYTYDVCLVLKMPEDSAEPVCPIVSLPVLVVSQSADHVVWDISCVLQNLGGGLKRSQVVA